MLPMMNGTLSQHYEDFVREARMVGDRAAAIRAVTVVVVLVGSTAAVYLSGGTKHVYPHLMYFAVVLAGMSFGRRAGVIVGAVAGLLIGPMMPLDLAAGIDQPTAGWLIRMGFFVGIGGLAGHARYRFHRLLDKRRTFTSSVSHELRTPLTAVLGFAEILHGGWNETSEAEKRELIGHIRRESSDVAHVIDDLLVAARIDGGRLQVEPEEVDVRAIADSTAALLGEKWGDRVVRVTGTGVSWADPLRVRQIVRNLLTNAMSYGGENIVVDIANGDDVAILTVRDDGPGVPVPVLPRLFEPFSNQAVPSTMPHSIGLGLSVSRELARRMGGRLSYRRENGQTIFILELPRRLTVPAEPSLLPATQRS